MAEEKRGRGMMTGYEFAKMTGIRDMYVRAAIDMYPPQHAEKGKRRMAYPRDEIAKSVRMYSKWLARKLKEQHRKRMEEIIEFAKRAAEVLEDASEDEILKTEG